MSQYSVDRQPKQNKKGGSKYRLIAGLKQSELARQLGVDEMTVVNWEIGRTEPCKKYRKKISELLLVS